MNIKENKQILLISPRGFCAGVTRAIDTVVEVLEKFGPPVYVKHEIVHNKHVIEDLKAKGAIFIEDINDAPIDKPLVLPHLCNVAQFDLKVLQLLHSNIL